MQGIALQEHGFELLRTLSHPEHNVGGRDSFSRAAIYHQARNVGELELARF
jgi:hypothetical protein